MEVNFKKLKEELIKIYEEFLENPESKKVQEKIINYERKWGGLVTYNEIFSKEIVPENIRSALANLSLLYQYGEHPDTHELSKEKILKIAEETAKKLKEKQ